MFYKQKAVTYSHKKVVNLYIFYEIATFHSIGSHPTATNAVFGAVKLTKNTDFDKYKYFGYGIGFNGKGFYSHSSGATGRNVIIFGVDMSSSTKIGNKKRHFSSWNRPNTRIRLTLIIC